LSKIHLSVDTEKDTNLMNKIISKSGKMFTAEDVLEFLEEEENESKEFVELS